MARPLADVVLHPVRLAVIAALGDGEMTTGDLAERLPAVPQATLYRHVARLVDAGLIDVVAETKVRGAVERTYRLGPPATVSAGAGAADALESFTRFAASLLADFARYARSPGADPTADGAGFRQVTLWLTDAEFGQFASDFGRVLAAAAAHRPGEGRSAVNLTTVLIPAPVANPGS
ncbi:MAG: helix-turn-helix domain-containing protein [Dehalococcoidia bacterium]